MRCLYKIDWQVKSYSTVAGLPCVSATTKSPHCFSLKANHCFWALSNSSFAEVASFAFCKLHSVEFLMF